MSDWLLIQILNAVLRRLFLSGLCRSRRLIYAIAVPFSSLAQVAQTPTTYRCAQPLQPIACPREFNAQNRQSNGYDDKRGSGRNDHDDTDQEYGHPRHGNDNAAPCLVCEMHSSLEQRARSASDAVRFPQSPGDAREIRAYDATHRTLTPHHSCGRSGSRKRVQRPDRYGSRSPYASSPVPSGTPLQTQP